MTEPTEADVTRLAEMVMCVPLMPELTTDERMRLARYLLERGVKLPPPPPDPAVVVAEALSLVLWPYFTWDPDALHPEQQRLIAAVRDLFTPEALTQAAAKVQEADRDG